MQVVSLPISPFLSLSLRACLELLLSVPIVFPIQVYFQSTPKPYFLSSAKVGACICSRRFGSLLDIQEHIDAGRH